MNGLCLTDSRVFGALYELMGASHEMQGCIALYSRAIATTSFSGESVSAMIGTGFQKQACFAFRRVFYEKGLKVSLLDKVIWVLVCFSFLSDFFSICFAHGGKLHILDEETHLMYLCVIIFRVSTVN